MFDRVFVARGAEARAAAGASAVAASALVATGIGPRAAALAAATAYASAPFATALVLGTCGALAPWLGIGDVLLYGTLTAAAETAPLVLDAGLAAVAGERLPAALGGIAGVSSDRIAVTASEKRDLAERYGAQAVDMESHAIVRELVPRGVRCTVVRVVSDASAGDLPDLNRALTGSGELDPASLALVLARAPLATLRLAAGGGKAVRKLAPALAELLA